MRPREAVSAGTGTWRVRVRWPWGLGEMGLVYGCVEGKGVFEGLRE